MNRPTARNSKRSFTLCYVRREGRREEYTPNNILGYSLRVFFIKKNKPVYTISAHSESWAVVDNNYFDSLNEMYLIAEVFYKISPSDWIGVHPDQGEKLYSKPITKIEKLHKSIVKLVNEYRSRTCSLAEWNEQKAKWAGVK